MIIMFLFDSLFIFHCLPGMLMPVMKLKTTIVCGSLTYI